MKNRTKCGIGTLLSGVLAGGMIALGGTVYLSVESRLAGAALFGIGLFFVVSMRLWLFTGKVGYLLRGGKGYGVRLLLTFAGNFAGGAAVALALRQTRAAQALTEKAAALCAVKLGDTAVSVFVLAVFCGALMYLGVNGFSAFSSALGQYGGVFLAVVVFILSGYEHCIANLYYYTLAGVWGDSRAWVSMAVMVLGNGVGAVLVAELSRAAQRLMEE